MADHPHACGENDLNNVYKRQRPRTIPTRVGRTPSISDQQDYYDGPSPRVWGEQQILKRGIPAPTGPSPRVWGERNLSGIASAPPAGPSPRVWGELSAVGDPHSKRTRTIPTRVGRTSSVINADCVLRTIPTRVGRTRSALPVDTS